MIKIGSNEIVKLPSADKVFVGGRLVWLSPDKYRKLTGIKFDGGVIYDTKMRLFGSDTLQFSFRATKACNVLGCYTSATAETNYSLYVSTTSSAKYLRYDGETYNSYIATNTTYDVTISPTGSSGMRVDSNWQQKTFETDSDLLIGTTSYAATSAKFTGNMYGDIVVVGRARFAPYERVSDGAIIYVDMYSGKEFENVGTGTPVSLGYA